MVHTGTNYWANLGTIDGMINFTDLINFGHTIISGKVLSLFFDGTFGGYQVVVAADLMTLVMSLATAAYVIVKSVQAGVSFMQGFYFNYADWSVLGNLLFLFDLAAISMWQFYAVVITAMALFGAGDVWTKLDTRMAEAAKGSKGLENALDWDVVFKTVTLMFVCTLGVVISGVSLGDVADELITFFDAYDDDTSKEGTDKDSGKKDPHGTAVVYDILYHTGLTAYSYFVLSAISMGGYIFMFLFSPLDTVVLQCEFDAPADAYAAAPALLKQVTDYDACMAVIDKLFEIEDLDNNGIVTKCEDANLQYAFGATKEYATKFAGQYTRAAFRNICFENFPNHYHN